jgi:hypothetical protein
MVSVLSELRFKIAIQILGSVFSGSVECCERDSIPNGKAKTMHHRSCTQTTYRSKATLKKDALKPTSRSVSNQYYSSGKTMIFVSLVVSLSTAFIHSRTNEISLNRGWMPPNNSIQNTASFHRLRWDWSNLSPTSTLAKQVATHQLNCLLPLGNFKFRNRFGLGSDLHVWSQAMCNAMETNVRIRTVPDWLWMDQQACSHTKSPLLCYFPNAELQCPNDIGAVQGHPTFDGAFSNLSHGPRLGTISFDCPSIVNSSNSRQHMEMAGIEYLFGRVSPLVIQEAQRQHKLVFQGPSPKDLITVQIRWGDKRREMKLLDIQTYIRAIEKLLKERPRPVVNIFLATEDPDAVEQFTKVATERQWNVYLDQFYKELLPHRGDDYNNVPKASLQNKGRMGTLTLASLLISMEANEYVLTTSSNWSRLMDELRMAIVNPRCNNCTKVIDLKPAF